ncbi:MAG: hypothetical protein FJ095_10735 [Deltaproteobacteria bacterium]|nr:hypothetical protein [Deltaproteobacteria bacterium]
MNRDRDHTFREKLHAGCIAERRLIEVVFPERTNPYGTLFGGQALALMDMAAFVAASRSARRTVVTGCSEKCDFLVPVRQGHHHPRLLPRRAPAPQRSA